MTIGSSRISNWLLPVKASMLGFIRASLVISLVMPISIAFINSARGNEQIIEDNLSSQVESDLIFSKIQESIKNGNMDSALNDISNYRRVSTKVPPAIMFLEANLSEISGDGNRLSRSLAEYFSENDIVDHEYYKSAILLLEKLKNLGGERYEIFQSLSTQSLDGSWTIMVPGNPNPPPGRASVASTFIFSIKNPIYSLSISQTSSKKSVNFQTNCTKKSSNGHIVLNCMKTGCPKKMGNAFSGTITFDCGYPISADFFRKNGRVIVKFCHGGCEEMDMAKRLLDPI